MNASAPTLDGSPWVERVAALAPREFRERYLLPRRPVVLTDALAHWNALQRFTPAFFRDAYAERPVRIRGRTIASARSSLCNSPRARRRRRRIHARSPNATT